MTDETILKAYQGYEKREFDCDDFYLTKTLPLNGIYYIACTNIGKNEGYEISTLYNAKEQRYEDYFNDEVVHTTDNITIEDFVSDLENASFDDFIRDAWDYASEKLGIEE